MTKSKHKHCYKPCLLKSINLYRNNVTILETAYCEICYKVNQYGKLGSLSFMTLDDSGPSLREFLNDHMGIKVFDVENPLGTKYIERSISDGSF